MITAFIDFHSGAESVFTPRSLSIEVYRPAFTRVNGVNVTSKPARERICKYENVLADPLSSSGAGVLWSTTRIRPRIELQLVELEERASWADQPQDVGGRLSHYH